MLLQMRNCMKDNDECDGYTYVMLATQRWLLLLLFHN